jgi:hypothetical protein
VPPKIALNHPCRFEDRTGSCIGFPHTMPVRISRLGEFVEYLITTAGGMPTRGETRKLPKSGEVAGSALDAEDSSAQTIYSVRVLEQTSVSKADCFSVAGASGKRWTVPVDLARGYITKCEQCLLEVYSEDGHQRLASLRGEFHEGRRCWRNPGQTRRINRRAEVWNGYRWLTHEEANDCALVEPQEVGKLSQFHEIGSGAYDSPAEFRFAVLLWCVHGSCVIDLRDQGEWFEVFDTKAEALVCIQQMQALDRRRRQ